MNQSTSLDPNSYISCPRNKKKYVKTLPCLGIPSVNFFKIVQTDASNIGYGGILLQCTSLNSPKQIVHFHLGIWLLKILLNIKNHE